jgi:hypothetical protein
MDPIASLTVTLEGANDQRCIDGFVAMSNVMGMTVQEFLEQHVRAMGRKFADDLGIGVMPSSEFLLRFAPDEYAGIVEDSKTDKNAADLLAELRREPNVVSDDSRVGPGLQYFVATGRLDESRPAQLMAYERPEPRDLEAEAQAKAQVSAAILDRQNRRSLEPVAASRIDENG